MIALRTTLLAALALSIAPFGSAFADESAGTAIQPGQDATAKHGFYCNMVGAAPAMKAGSPSASSPAPGNALPAPTYNPALPAPTYNSALPAPTYSSDNQETEEHEHGSGGHGDDKGGGKKTPLSQTIQNTTQNAMQQQTSPQ